MLSDKYTTLKKQIKSRKLFFGEKKSCQYTRTCYATSTSCQYRRETSLCNLQLTGRGRSAECAGAQRGNRSDVATLQKYFVMPSGTEHLSRPVSHRTGKRGERGNFKKPYRVPQAILQHSGAKEGLTGDKARIPPCSMCKSFTKYNASEIAQGSSEHKKKNCRQPFSGLQQSFDAVQK